MILKKYKIPKNKHVRIRKNYERTGHYCIGCIYFSAVCSLQGEEKAPKRNTPKLCIKDMKRWNLGHSGFIYHAL